MSAHAARAGGGGVAVMPPASLLVARAHDFLAAGPADAVELVGRVCQMPDVPRAIAEHLAGTLLGGLAEFARDPDGRWRRAEPRAGAGGCAPSDLVLASLSYAVVDVETTGGRPDGGDRVTEIAAVVVRDGAIAELYETLVNPQRSIPPWITSLTNISWDMVKDAPTFAQVAPRITALLRGNVFVAHNASFDWRFVTAEVQRATGERLEGRRLCTVRLARRLLPQLRRRSLDHVAHYYGVQITARHRATGDAVATAHVLLSLLRDAADRGCLTWAELDALLAPAAAARRRRPSALPHPMRRDDGA